MDLKSIPVRNYVRIALIPPSIIREFLEEMELVFSYRSRKTGSLKEFRSFKCKMQSQEHKCRVRWGFAEICQKILKVSCLCRFAIFEGEKVSLLDGKEVASNWGSLQSNGLEGSCSIDRSRILEVLDQLISKSKEAGTLEKTTDEVFS